MIQIFLKIHETLRLCVSENDPAVLRTHTATVRSLVDQAHALAVRTNPGSHIPSVCDSISWHLRHMVGVLDNLPMDHQRKFTFYSHLRLVVLIVDGVRGGLSYGGHKRQ